MNNQTRPSVWERSSILGLFRRMFRWKFIRRWLMALAWTATFIALLYGEENWRGRRAWNHFRQALEARGEQLDLKGFIPKPIPDEENFAAIPLIKSWFPKGAGAWGSNYARAEGLVRNPKIHNERRFLDLPAWKMALTAVQLATNRESLQKFESDKLDLAARVQAAPAVLEFLKNTEPDLAELRLASQRPHSRYPVNYDLENPWGILLPHLGKIKGACQRLELKACSELATGHPDRALEDVRLILYLADSVKEEPFSISYLVRLACVQIAIQPIWEGLAEHRWSDVQLAGLQKGLQAFDFFSAMNRPLAAERAAAVLTAELLYRHKYSLDNLGDSTMTASEWSLAVLLERSVPHGWYHLEQLNYCRLFDAGLEGTFDASRKRIFPAKVESKSHELERELAGSAGDNRLFSAVLVNHRLLAALLLPTVGNLSRKAALAQTATDEAAVACALERYRLANETFPETLAALTPRFMAALPDDVFSGDSFKYRRTADGRFVLYSVGWNEKDDGGTPGKTLFDEKQGDWVWAYPAK